MILGGVLAVGAILGWISGRMQYYVPQHANSLQTTRKSWTKPMIHAYISILFAVVFEGAFAHVVKNTLGRIDNYVCWLITLAIENGVLIVILWPILGYFFDKELGKENLNCQEEYDKKAVKISITAIVWILCLGAFFMLRDQYNGGKITSNIVYNRIIMWAIAPVGELVLPSAKKKSNEADRKKKGVFRRKALKTLRFVIKFGPIIVGLVVVATMVYYTVSHDERIPLAFLYYVLFIVSYNIFCFIVKRILSPNKVVSVNRFNKKLSRHKNKGRFGWMDYVYCNNMLEIKSVNIENPRPDKMEEFNNIFGRMTMEKCDDSEALKALVERFDKQHQYMDEVGLEK